PFGLRQPPVRCVPPGGFCGTGGPAVPSPLQNTSSRKRPYRAPFANRTIPFPAPVEVVPTPPENIPIIGYFRKIAFLKDFRPCNLAGHKRPLFPDGKTYVGKKRGTERFQRLVPRVLLYLTPPPPPLQP